jgi:hypothetical protein
MGEDSLSGISAATVWLKRLFFAAAIVLISLQWVNTRIAILRANQFVANPVLPTTYFIYHSMATGLGEGRVGQVDLAALRRHANLNYNQPWAPFERLPQSAEHQWVNFYTLDIGYGFIVEAARLMFRSLPDNHLRALALQLLVDAALVGFVYFLFSHWSNALGLLAALLYSSNQVFFDLVSFPFYYYWDIPLSFVVLGSIFLAYRRPGESVVWLTIAATALGFGVWLRGSWWPIGIFLLGVVAFHRPLRKHLLIPMVVFTVIAAPQVARASYARGRLTLSTRTVWHVALVGLGYYPNPYGLEAKDVVVFKLTRDKYGVEFKSEDYSAHDQAARQEYVEIWRKDPKFVIASFFGRLTDSVLGRTPTSVRAFRLVSNAEYDFICLLGFAAMMAKGGDRRLFGIAAAGTYAIYVGLTSVFYFVGLAYDSVSQVTLLVLCIGAIDAATDFARRTLYRLPVTASIADTASVSSNA